MSETKAQRRIRQAVENRGRKLVTLEYEPPFYGGEKSGMCGGWYGTLDGYTEHPLTGNNEIMGLNVEDAVAWVDEFLKAPKPCDCPPAESPLLSQTPKWVHQPTCEFHLSYYLKWWPRDGE